MQLSLIAVCAAFTAVTLAAPAPYFMRRADCDIAACVSTLAPTVVECVTAAVKKGKDIAADGKCLVAAANVVDKFPSACGGCVDDFDLGEIISDATEAVGDGIDAVGDGISNIAGKIGSIF
ncbi:hypothetical protein C8J57DRAFT_1478250 [Mycena rebaudengoi]|nr:hypothetical protein C8J57DRAFT_1478250 [Mycena rebaudengoi]